MEQKTVDIKGLTLEEVNMILSIFDRAQIQGIKANQVFMGLVQKIDMQASEQVKIKE